MRRKFLESISLRGMMPVMGIVITCWGGMTIAMMAAETSPVQMTAVLPWWVLLWRVVLSYSARVCYENDGAEVELIDIYPERVGVLPVQVYSSSLVYGYETMHIRRIVGCLAICHVRCCDLRRLWIFWCPVPVCRLFGCPDSISLLSPIASNSSRTQKYGPP